MNIGFDIDNTLTNPYDYVLNLTIKYLKDRGLSTDMVAPQKFDMLEKFGLSSKEGSKFWCEIAEDVLRNCDINGNINEVILKLKNEGHKIFLITARSERDLANVNPYVLTFNWLKKYGIVYDKLICRDDTKFENCLKYNIDIFVDDNIKVIKLLSEHGIDSILIEAQHNRYLKNQLPHNVKFASTPDDVYRIITQKATMHIDERIR